MRSMLVVAFLNWLGIYLTLSIGLYVIARKCGHDLAWLAFIPIADLWLLIDLADFPLIAILGFFIPPINLLLFLACWWRIAENTNKPGWIGLLMAVPYVNLVAIWFLATYETGLIVE